MTNLTASTVTNKGQLTSEHYIVAAPETEIDELNKKEFWHQVISNFFIGDDLTVVNASYSFEAKCKVVADSEGKRSIWIKSVVERKKSTVDKEEDEVDFTPYIMKWGGKAKWQIFDTINKEVVEKGIQDKEVAIAKVEKLNSGDSA